MTIVPVAGSYVEDASVRADGMPGSPLWSIAGAEGSQDAASTRVAINHWRTGTERRTGANGNVFDSSLSKRE